MQLKTLTPEQQKKFVGDSKLNPLMPTDRFVPLGESVKKDAWPPMPPQSYPSLDQGVEFQGMQIPNPRPVRDKNENLNIAMGLEPELPAQLEAREDQFYNLGQSDISDKEWNKTDYTLERPKDYKQVIAEQRGLAEEDVQIRQHPELDIVTYRTRGEDRKWGQEKRLEKGGLREGYQANKAALTGLGAEAIAGVGGTLFAGPLGGVAGAAAASAGQRAVRLLIGRGMGLNKDVNIAKESGIEALFSLGGSVAGEAIMWGVRRAISSSTIKVLMADMGPDAIADMKKTVAVFLQKSGQSEADAALNVDQVFRQSDLPSSTKQRISATTSQVRPFSKKLKSQGDELEREILDLSEGAELVAMDESIETALAAPKITSKILSVAKQEADDRILQVESQAASDTAKFETVLDEITQSPEIGESFDLMRNQIASARESVLTGISKKYQDFWSSIPSAKIDPTPLNNFAVKWKKRLEQDIFPFLAQEDKSIIENALNFGKKTKTIPAVPEGQILDQYGNVIQKAAPEQSIEVSVPANFEQISRAISVIKEELRREGIDRRGAKGLLIKLKKTLTGMRDDALEGVDDVAMDELKALDNTLSSTMRNLEQSNINNIVKSLDKGLSVSGVEANIGRLLGGKGIPSKRFMELATNPNSDIFVKLPAIKDTIKAFYKDSIEGKTGKGLETVHTNFMKKYGRGMQNILTDEEFKAFSSGADATVKKLAEISSKRRSALLKLEDIGVEGRVDNIVDWTLSGKNPIERTKTIMKIIGGDQELKAQYKGLRGRRLLNDISEMTDSGPEFSVKKMDVILKSTAQLGELGELFGHSYVRGLKKIQKIARLSQEGTGGNLNPEILRLIQEQGPQSATMAIWRAFVARPLSRAGLLTTGAFKLLGAQGKKSLGNLIANPEKFLTALELYSSNAPINQWAPVLGAIGLGGLIDETEGPQSATMAMLRDKL
jgi:hypothetical protein|tara:strand:+ start:589 stop:3438 length:2850 start_codon:yes stop_codon:yes gene_type:complete